MRQLQQKATTTYHKKTMRGNIQSHTKTMIKENDMLRDTGVRQIQWERTSRTTEELCGTISSHTQ